MAPDASTPVEVFFSYSHIDEELRDRLARGLTMLKREGIISEWHDRRVAPGQEWGGEIDSHLNSAGIILLLVSTDFLASDYCYDVEVKRAMQRHQAGEARVIPVILRPCDWAGAPFAKIQVLPKDAKPVTLWADLDEAFLDVAKGIRKAAEEVGGRGSSELVCHPETSPIESAPHRGFRLHVDNTLAHGVVRCFERRATEVDVAGLLGLANFLVFADTVVLGHLELDTVRRISEGLAAELRGLNLEGGALKHVRVSQDTFEDACREAAAKFAPQVKALLRGFRPLSQHERVALRPEGLEVDVERYQRVHDLVSGDAKSEAELADIAMRAIAGRRSVGALEYALAVDDSLREELRRAFVHRPWSLDVTERVVVLFKIHLNHVLAASQGALHAPAPGRVRLVRDLISTAHPAPEVNPLRHLDLLVPDVARFLAKRGGGDPRDVLAAAIELREKAAGVRLRLRTLARDLIDGQDGEARSDFREEARRLIGGSPGREAPEDSGLKLHLLYIGSKLGLELKLWRRGPVVAVAHDSAFFDPEAPDFRTLVRRSCGS